MTRATGRRLFTRFGGRASHAGGGLCHGSNPFPLLLFYSNPSFLSCACSVPFADISSCTWRRPIQLVDNCCAATKQPLLSKISDHVVAEFAERAPSAIALRSLLEHPEPRISPTARCSSARTSTWRTRQGPPSTSMCPPSQQAFYGEDIGACIRWCSAVRGPNTAWLAEALCFPGRVRYVSDRLRPSASDVEITVETAQGYDSVRGPPSTSRCPPSQQAGAPEPTSKYGRAHQGRPAP